MCDKKAMTAQMAVLRLPSENHLPLFIEIPDLVSAPAAQDELNWLRQQAKRLTHNLTQRIASRSGIALLSIATTESHPNTRFTEQYWGAERQQPRYAD